MNLHFEVEDKLFYFLVVIIQNIYHVLHMCLQIEMILCNDIMKLTLIYVPTSWIDICCAFKISYPNILIFPNVSISSHLHVFNMNSIFHVTNLSPFVK